MTVKGIDISRAQEVFDFEAAKAAGVKFVIIRAGIGTDTDTYFRRNLAECKRLGLPFGFYWYFKALSDTQFAAELAACTKAVKGEKPEYPIFCDIEEQKQIELLTPKQRTDWALKFCEQMTENGLPSGVYANPSWMEHYFDKDRLIGKCDIWLAHWTGRQDIATKYDYGQNIWQWGVDYIGGKKVDGNICYVDYPKLTAAWYGNHSVKPDEPADRHNFKVGDTVTVNAGALSYGGTRLASFVYGRQYKVLQAGKANATDYIVIGENGNVTAAVNAHDLTRVTAKKPKFKVGDLVRVRFGAKTYGGKALAAFVYTGSYTVMQAGLGEKTDYIVIGQGGNVTAAVNASDLIPVFSA